MRVIYTEFSDPHWVDVVLRLQQRGGWDPALWVGHPRVAEAVASRLPQTVFWNHSDAMRLRLPAGLVAGSVPLGAELLASLSRYQAITIRMMGRKDNDGRCFTTEQRYHYYHKMASLMLGVLESVRPGLVVFVETPHSLYDHVLYGLCRVMGIPTLAFVRSKVLKYVYAAPGVEEVADPVSRELACVNREYGERSVGDDVPEDLERERQRLLGDHLDGMPERARLHHEEARRRRGVRWRYYGRLAREWLHVVRDQMRSLIGGAGAAAYGGLKSPARYCLSDGMTKLEYRQATLRGRMLRHRIERVYRELCRPVDLSTRYVYLPLNYQPERTTHPDGGFFGDLLLVASNLSLALPDGWLLLVREHPVTFLDDMAGSGRGHMMREPGFYAELAKLPNVRFVSMSVDGFELIDRAQAVASPTGTALWEAVTRGKPGLCFGHVWYGACPGVYDGSGGAAALGQFFEALQAGELTLDDGTRRERVLRFLLALHRVAKPARISRKFHDDVMDAAANVAALADILTDSYARYWGDGGGGAGGPTLR